MDKKPISEKRVSPTSTQAHLRYQQDFLKQSYPSCDMSEVSFQTDFSDFPGSRHSSLPTEPLTLDNDQILDAKDLAEDVLEKVGPEVAGEIFTTVDVGEEDPGQSQSEAFSKQLNSLVEKAQQVVAANEVHSQSMGKLSAPSSSAPSEASPQPEEIIESVSAPSSPAPNASTSSATESDLLPSAEELSSSDKVVSPEKELTPKTDRMVPMGSWGKSEVKTT